MPKGDLMGKIEKMRENGKVGVYFNRNSSVLG
jgi:hypothetical protein